jgi:hypothetical protein
MAKRRRRRVRLGSTPQKHYKEAERALHDFQLIVRDMQLSQGPIDCRMLFRQLHGANTAQGTATAHIYSLPSGAAPTHSFKGALDKLRNELATVEHHFANACLVSK